jgi:translocation and assembly module TamA
MIQNRALRYGFFDGKFTPHELLVDPKGGLRRHQSGLRKRAALRAGQSQLCRVTRRSTMTLLQRMVPFKPDTPLRLGTGQRTEPEPAIERLL